MIFRKAAGSDLHATAFHPDLSCGQGDVEITHFLSVLRVFYSKQDKKGVTLPTGSLQVNNHPAFLLGIETT